MNFIETPLKTKIEQWKLDKWAENLKRQRELSSQGEPVIEVSEQRAILQEESTRTLPLIEELASPVRKISRRGSRFYIDKPTLSGSFSCLSAAACGLSIAGGDYKFAIAWGIPSAISTAFSVGKIIISRK